MRSSNCVQPQKNRQAQARRLPEFNNVFRTEEIQFWGCSARRKTQRYLSIARLCNNAMRTSNRIQLQKTHQAQARWVSILGSFLRTEEIQFWGCSARRRIYWTLQRYLSIARLCNNAMRSSNCVQPQKNRQAQARRLPEFNNVFRTEEIQFWGCSARRKTQRYLSIARLCNNAMRPTIEFIPRLSPYLR